MGFAEVRQALLGTLGLFVAAHLICATAPNYTILLLGRILAAASHGCLNGLTIVTAASLAPEQKRGSAIAVVLAVVPVANILGVPAGDRIFSHVRLARGGKSSSDAGRAGLLVPWRSVIPRRQSLGSTAVRSMSTSPRRARARRD